MYIVIRICLLNFEYGVYADKPAAGTKYRDPGCHAVGSKVQDGGLGIVLQQLLHILSRAAKTALMLIAAVGLGGLVTVQHVVVLVEECRCKKNLWIMHAIVCMKKAWISLYLSQISAINFILWRDNMEIYYQEITSKPRLLLLDAHEPKVTHAIAEILLL